MAGWLEDLLMQGGAIPQQMAAALQGTGMRPQEGGAWMKPQEPGMLNAAAMVPPPVPAQPEMPPSTNDPTSREPQLFKDGVPLPRPRPSVPELQQPQQPETAVPTSTPQEPPPQTALAADPAAFRPPPPSAPINNSPPGGGGFGGILGKIFDPANAPLLLAMGGGFAGAPSLGTGMRRGFTAAAPQAALLRQEQMKLEPQAANEKAMLARGVPADLARAASMNKDLFNQIAPQVFGAKQRDWVVIRENLDGSKEWGWVDKAAHKVYDLTGREVTPESAAASNRGANLEPKYNEHGLDEDFLKAQEPIAQSVIKGIVNGDASVSGRNLQKYLPYAIRYDQNFKGQQDYASRLNLEKSYHGGGEGFKQLRAANTAITHGVQLIDAIKDLRNFDTLPALNAPLGAIQRQYDPRYQAARKTFEANAEPFARELDFALTGKSTVSGQHEIRKLLDVNAATTENMASITRLLSLLKGRVDEHEHAYTSGRKSLKLPLEALSEKNRNSLESIVSGTNAPGQPAAVGQTAAPAAGGKPQTVRQNGFTYTLQPDGTYK